MKGLTVLALFSAICVNCRAACLKNTSNVENVKNSDVCSEDDGIWGPLIENWTVQNKRGARVMILHPVPNSYIIEEKIDNDMTEKESKISPGKIVSTGNVNKKPPPARQISETDLYLLGAIEKLVYRVDFMEKRLRRVEEMLYYAVAGNRIDNEPCPNNFTRVGADCYQFFTSAGREYDWKVASKKCKSLGGFLAEMETIEENQDVIAFIQSNQYLRGKDFWVGGLNPGLLWIWSNSARPVKAPGSHNNTDNPSTAIKGDGRCLRLAYNPALRTYTYQGTDCSIRFSHICELPQKTSSNEIRRLGRSRRIFSDES
ncbi:uncharacterized protein LOC108903562 [Anoplophora glabripennis]|uniref:uncharacterized protein LOC108903562 n=1 Tax=Anoplophora glabripennis TaxID=217634 RepID=UPI000C75D50E|nr:uncharacterized protein LOC108903562 [Anoplophora glabripennis]